MATINHSINYLPTILVRLTYTPKSLQVRFIRQHIIFNTSETNFYWG